jgi:hypothetical protein
MSQLHYYKPSGKYNRSSLVVIFIVVYILSSISGFNCAWLISENGILYYVDITLIIFFIGFFLCLNGLITSIFIKCLKIRNPQKAFKIGLAASSLGWITFNCLSKYWILSKGNVTFVDFLIIRSTNGFPAGVTIGSEAVTTTIHFYAPWFIAVPTWLCEIFFFPFALARFMETKAGEPFSEKTKTWHKRIIPPYTIFIPTKKQFKLELTKGNPEVFLRLKPERYLEKNEINWGRISLYIPSDSEDYTYIYLCNYFSNVLCINKRNIFSYYYVIDDATAKELLSRFGYRKSTK